MTEISGKAEDGPKWGKMALPALAGGICGALAVMAMLQVFDRQVFGELAPSAMIAAAVALVYVMIAIGIGVGTASPAFGARFLNVEDAEELREQRQGLVASASAMLALGLALGVLAVSGPDGGINGQTAAIIAGVLLLTGGMLSIRSARFSDELMRAVNNETGNVAYYLVFVILGGWAALAHVDLVPAPAMLDVLSLLWTLVLLAAFIVTGKRGMLNPR